MGRTADVYCADVHFQSGRTDGPRHPFRVPPRRPAALVLEDDVLALTQVSGIGKKSAQHIFLELKYKLKVEDIPAAASLQLGVPGSVYRDALTGLEGLGYAEAEAAPVLKNILHEEPDLEVSEALRAALKALARERQK